jgi:hypothetical protein
MKRLRAFWEIEPNALVGKVLEALMHCAKMIGPLQIDDEKRANEIISKLLGKTVVRDSTVTTQESFLKEEFANLNTAKLNIDGQLSDVINQRVKEIQKSLTAQISLATIFLCGSTLEGLLLDIATKNAPDFNTSTSSPKGKDGKVKPLHEWSLESLINVAHETRLISLDVKKFSHALKDFRNYIHPRQQASQGFKPDEHTARISWQVLQAAIADLSGQRGK